MVIAQKPTYLHYKWHANLIIKVQTLWLLLKN